MQIYLEWTIKKKKRPTKYKTKISKKWKVGQHRQKLLSKHDILVKICTVTRQLWVPRCVMFVTFNKFLCFFLRNYIDVTDFIPEANTVELVRIFQKLNSKCCRNELSLFCLLFYHFWNEKKLEAVDVLWFKKLSLHRSITVCLESSKFTIKEKRKMIKHNKDRVAVS